MDNVSVERNVDMVGEIITSINTVILHDVSLSSESWARLSQHWSERSKNLVTLELFQLLSVTEDTGLFKNPGFSPKTQPSGFNWFKPGLTGFYGLNWVKLRMPLTMAQFWFN